VLLGTDPYVAVAPFAEFAQFLYFGVRVVGVVFDGEAGGIVLK